MCATESRCWRVKTTAPGRAPTTNGLYIYIYIYSVRDVGGGREGEDFVILRWTTSRQSNGAGTFVWPIKRGDEPFLLSLSIHYTIEQIIIFTDAKHVADWWSVFFFFSGC